MTDTPSEADPVSDELAKARRIYGLDLTDEERAAWVRARHSRGGAELSEVHQPTEGEGMSDRSKWKPEYDDLAAYNAQVYRGRVFPAEVNERMAAIQEDYDRNYLGVTE